MDLPLKAKKILKVGNSHCIIIPAFFFASQMLDANDLLDLTLHLPNPEETEPRAKEDTQ